MVAHTTLCDGVGRECACGACGARRHGPWTRLGGTIVIVVLGAPLYAALLFLSSRAAISVACVRGGGALCFNGIHFFFSSHRPFSRSTLIRGLAVNVNKRPIQ